jgi:uncharacterized DUF497 family protein
VLFTFDPEKSARNAAERGLPFERVRDMDWQNSYIVEDTRRDWGELRYKAFGVMDGRLHIAVFTPRDDTIRIISFRRASRSEERMYAEERPGRTARR